MGPYVVDSYAACHRLVIEIDGGIHDDCEARDRRRERELVELFGVRVIRVNAADVEHSIWRVLATIRSALHPW